MNSELNLDQIIENYKELMENSYQKAIFVSVSKDIIISCDKYPYVSLNFEITKEFQQFEKKSGRKVTKLVEQLVRKKESQFVILDYFELLFEPYFHINPIDLFLNISKVQPLIIIWRYEVKKESLIYSEPNHFDYFKQTLSKQIPIVHGGK